MPCLTHFALDPGMQQREMDGGRDVTELDDERTRVVAPPRAVTPDPDRTVIPDPMPLREGGVVDQDPDRTVVKPRTRAPAAAAITPRAEPRRAGFPPPPPPPPLPLPRNGGALALPAGLRLHEYRIDGVLGQGGFGITYLATDVNLSTRVAIKEYLPEEIAFRKAGQTVSPHSSQHRARYRAGLESFLVEARTLATFRHPNIVRVARFFEAHETAYMVLEYERGSPLRTWWPGHAQMPEKDLVRLLEPLLDGLAVVHAAGFLHRDIKPDNIQVRRDTGELVLLDFGSAREAVTHGGQADVAITPGYAPLEQYQDGDQGAWTDLYALGATLYWMITGKRPPEAVDRLGAVDPLLPATDAARGRYSPEFLASIDWALRVDANARPRSVADWRAALFAAQATNLGLQDALRAGDASPAPRRAGARTLHALRAVVGPAAWPLAVKMTLAMVLTALAPMVVTAYYNLQGSLAATAAGELGKLEQLAGSTAGRLSQLIGDSQHLARVLGTDAAFVGFLSHPDAAAAQAMRSKLDAVAAANPDIHLLMVMDTHGTAVVSSDPQVEGKNFRFREYFKVAMQGRPYVTGIVVGAVAGAAGMFYSYPVYGDQRNVIGAVVLRIRASSIAKILEGIHADRQLTPFLVDADGVLVYHPDERLLYRSLAPLAPAALAQIRADQRFRRDRIDDLGMSALAHAMVAAPARGHIAYRSTISGHREIAGFAPVPGQGWTVAVAESRADFEEPLNHLFRQVLWSVALVGMLSLGLALRFARSIVRPVRALTAAADALKSGDYARASISVRNRDEIGQLARTFNVMIDVLRQRERERTRASAGAGADRTRGSATP